MKCISSLGIHTRRHIYLTLYWISFKFLLHCIKTQNIGLFSLMALHGIAGWLAASRHFYFLKLQNNKIVKLQTCRIVKLQYNCIKTQNNDLMALLWMTCSKLLGTFQPASSSTTSCCSAKITRTKLSIQFRSLCAAFCFHNFDWVLAKTSGTFWGMFLPKNPF